MPRARRVGATQLSLGRPPERLAGLLRAQKQLLDRIARRKKERSSFEEHARKLSRELATHLSPLVDACLALDAEIHALFQELLEPGRLAKRGRRQVERLYGTLQLDGILTRSDGDEDEEEGGDDLFDDVEEEQEEDAAGSAPRPGKRGPIESIRAVYRRLANAIHPDKVQDEGERARRTEIMKDVTRAYGDGDFARLLELERTWAANREHDSASDDIGQRCAVLERTNDELRVQLRAIDRELRGLRHSPHGDIVRQARSGRNAIGEMVADARSDRDDLQSIRDHAVAFRDGKMSLADFLAGPGADAAEVLLREAATFLAELDRDLAKPRRRSGARSR